MKTEKGRAVYGLLGVDCEWVVGMGGGVKIEHYGKPLIDRDWFGNKWREYKYMDLDAKAAPT